MSRRKALEPPKSPHPDDGRVQPTLPVRSFTPTNDQATSSQGFFGSLLGSKPMSTKEKAEHNLKSILEALKKKKETLDARRSIGPLEMHKVRDPQSFAQEKADALKKMRTLEAVINQLDRLIDPKKSTDEKKQAINKAHAFLENGVIYFSKIQCHFYGDQQQVFERAKNTKLKENQERCSFGDSLFVIKETDSNGTKTSTAHMTDRYFLDANKLGFFADEEYKITGRDANGKPIFDPTPLDLLTIRTAKQSEMTRLDGDSGPSDTQKLLAKLKAAMKEYERECLVAPTSTAAASPSL